MSQARYGRKKKLMGEINVVPYIDVMLVLLIIFMVTTPLLSTGVSVELPKASAKPLENPDEEPFVVTVDQEGKFFLNDDETEVAEDREIELKAFGTVPLVAPEVDVDSYFNPWKEGVHYFRVKDGDDVTRIVSETKAETWQKMSEACRAWYLANSSVQGSFRTTLECSTI